MSGQSYRAPSPAGEGGGGGGAVGAEPLQGGGGAAGAGGEPLQGGGARAGGELLQEDVADSETSPALSPRLQRQQSSVLLLDQVVIVLATEARLKMHCKNRKHSGNGWARRLYCRISKSISWLVLMLSNISGSCSFKCFSSRLSYSLVSAPRIWTEWKIFDPFLRFQKHLLIFVSITTLLCICLILPFNFQVKIPHE